MRKRCDWHVLRDQKVLSRPSATASLSAEGKNYTSVKQNSTKYLYSSFLLATTTPRPFPGPSWTRCTTPATREREKQKHIPVRKNEPGLLLDIVDSRAPLIMT